MSPRNRKPKQDPDQDLAQDFQEAVLSPMKWEKSDYRGEYTCAHGVGHGNHVHGCDGCCGRPDYPLRSSRKEP